jgi:hypothetical protein
MTSTPILVQTNVRKSTADDLPANQALLHCLATSDGDATYFRNEPFTLTSKELQTVHNTALSNRFQRELRRDEVHARPSKDSLIIGPNEGDSFAEGHLRTSHENMIVTLYDGPKEGLDALNEMGYGEVICVKSPDGDTEVEPKPALKTYNSSKFTRSWISSSPESQRARSRWFQVLQVKDAPADTDWSKVLATLYQNVDTAATQADWVTNVRFCRVPVKINRNTISTQQLEQCGNNAVRDSQISESTGIPLRSIKQLAGLHKRAIPASLHDVQGQGSFLGVDLISGLQRSFRSDENENLYVVEKARTALVHSDKPYTLADVVSQRHQHQAQSLHDREVIAMLNEEFRHVKISVVGKNSETRTIAGFREGSISQAPINLRHYAWTSRGQDFGLPHLPCVNVGTHADPKLLPLELCTVLPSQRLRGPIDASLSRMAEHHRAGIVSQLQPDSEITGRVVVSSPSPDNDGTLNEKVARACGGGFPNLLFVEASTSRVESPNWVALQDSIRELIKTSLEEHASSQYAQTTVVPACQKHLLSLQYRLNAENSDRWTEQLRDFTALHKAIDKQQTFVVVYLPADNRNNEMYKIIKKACDTTVGVQTFFVNHANLEARVCGSPTDGVARVASELRRRICLRNPRILVGTTSRKTPTGPKRLVISMHIAPVTFPSKSRIASGHVTELYIVALVSSDLETGSPSRTEINLFNADQVKQLDMEKLFAPFVDSLPSTGRYNLTILRSGHFPERQHTIASTDQSSVSATRPYTAEDEFADIREAFSEIVTPAECRYITLKEDKVLRLHVDTTDLTMPALVLVKSTRMMDRDQRSFRATHVLGENSSTGVIAMTVLCGPASAGTPNIRPKAQTPSLLPSPIKRQRSSIQLGGSPSSPFTKFNSPGRTNKQPASPRSIAPAPPYLTVETPSKTVLRGDAASRFESRVSSSTQIPLPDDLIDIEEEASVITQQLGELTVEPTEPAINETDAQALAELWDGRELELSGTKWPIVTHLAHLAVKRALLHLDSNDWDGTKAKGKATAPFFLPPVNGKVRNSLYYL